MIYLMPFLIKQTEAVYVVPITSYGGVFCIELLRKLQQVISLDLEESYLQR